MDNSLNDQAYREAYAAFSIDHDQQRNSLMQAIADAPVSTSGFVAQPHLNLWQKIPRRSLIVIAATAVIVVLTTILPSMLEMTPASVLADGWRRDYPISQDADDAAAEETLKPKIEAWTEDGWLIVRRKSAEGEIEWQVVLAKTKAAEEPEVTQSPEEIEVKFGKYLIRDLSSGELKIVRQVKAAKEKWPSLQLNEDKLMNASESVYGMKLAAYQVNRWIWVTGGLSRDDRRDVWLRLTPSAGTRVNHQSKSGLLSLTLIYGPYAATDDGRTFRADRTVIVNEVSKPE